MSSDGDRWRYFKKYYTQRRVTINGETHTYIQMELPSTPRTEMGFDIDGMVDELIQLGDKHNLHPLEGR